MLLSAGAVFGGYGAFRRFKRLMISHKTFENKVRRIRMYPASITIRALRVRSIIRRCIFQTRRNRRKYKERYGNYG